MRRRGWPGRLHSPASGGTLVLARFSGWEFDEGARALRDGAGLVRLSPKAFDLLGLLIARHPGAVPKTEIQEALWPDTFVSESNVTKLIREIRAALGDDARAPRFVRTVHRFGYAFVGDLGGGTDSEGHERSGRARARLVWKGRAMALLEGENPIGRTEENRLQVDAPTISRRHATIVIEQGEATLMDLGSKNGTFLRGERLSAPARLLYGDVLFLGSEQMSFERATGPAPTETGGPV